MTVGITILNASGAVRLGPGDYIHRLVATGSVNIGGPYRSVDVPFTGMTASDDWFILVAGDAVAHPGSGKFTITAYDWNYAAQPNAFYSVYRR